VLADVQVEQREIAGAALGREHRRDARPLELASRPCSAHRTAIGSGNRTKAELTESIATRAAAVSRTAARIRAVSPEKSYRPTTTSSSSPGLASTNRHEPSRSHAARS
jgi:hypothetical protein